VFVKGDICCVDDIEKAYALGQNQIDAVIHFAAETHVDRSIEESSTFIRTNVLGTQVLLEATKRHLVKKFIHVSTYEVYGSLGENGIFSEETPLAPNSPYSASKAASDLLSRAYFKTYGLPVCITRCSNNYGPRQFPEKLIPLMIASALEDKPLPVYGDGLNIRDWIYVEDHCRGIMSVLLKGKPGEVYNFGGNTEMTNLSVVKKILHLLGKPESLIEFVLDRPGHDYRYAIDISKAKAHLGWSPVWTFCEGLENTIKWYLDNPRWPSKVREHYLLRECPLKKDNLYTL
jgi:dTDP-glucose 4,6-dehydratase